MLASEMPILRLELLGMKQTIMRAITDRADDIRKAVEVQMDAILQRDGLDDIISRAVRAEVHEAISRAVKDFFASYGDGGKAIRDAVKSKLAEVLLPAKEDA